MKITFWGVRGSLPCPLAPDELRQRMRELIWYFRAHGIPTVDEEEAALSRILPGITGLAGGNTACVEVTMNGGRLIFDAGSGIRALGRSLMKGSCGKGRGKLRIFFSHTHWDHIQGLPYFQPLYKSGNKIEIYSGFQDIAERLEHQQWAEFFPLPLKALSAEISYHQLKPQKLFTLGKKDGFQPQVTISIQNLPHPGGVHGYRVESEGKTLVYATDTGFNGLVGEDYQRALAFFADADWLIFDSHFSHQDSLIYKDWGHASAINGVDIAHRAKVKRLFLFHHSPDYPDEKLYELLEEAREYNRKRYPGEELGIDLAVEGMIIDGNS